MSTFKNVTAAEYVRYNANAAGRSTGDCVKRALSLAFDVPYNEMAKELIAEMKRQKMDLWCVKQVYNQVIRAHGGPAKHIAMEPQNVTLADFVDTTAKNGTWLICTGPKPNGLSNHIVCAIDGTVYDSWDSLDQYVCQYYKIDNAPERHFTEIHVLDYREEIEETVHNVGDKLIRKYPWFEYLRSFEAKFITFKGNEYKARIDLTLQLKPRPYRNQATNYGFNFSIVFTPSTTDEEAHKIIKQTVQTRMYDRLYSVNVQEKKLEEAFEVGGVDGADVKYWMDAREERFYKSLPGRIQGIIQYVDIDRPGQYSDSYTVRITPQHGEDAPYIRLYAIDAPEMKELLEHYIKTGETYVPY